MVDFKGLRMVISTQEVKCLSHSFLV
jgi:hypothetical protein